MKAIRTGLIFLTVILLLGAIGCTGSGGGSAKMQVVNFFDAMYEQDYGSALPYCTQRAIDSSEWSRIREDHSTGGNIWTESKIVEIEHGSRTIEIYSQDNENLRLWVIKTDAGWMIDEFEYRRSSSSDRDRDRDDEPEEDEGDEDDGRMRRERD